MHSGVALLSDHSPLTMYLECPGPIEGQIYYKECKPCVETCQVSDIPCDEECEPGCGCPQGEVIDLWKLKCVPEAQCPQIQPPPSSELCMNSVKVVTVSEEYKHERKGGSATASWLKCCSS